MIMQPRLVDFEQCPPQTLRDVRVVLTDIDDTITTDGALTAEAYAALERLQRAGLRVVPVTGRPAGWCDLIARFWPVDGVVGENGALVFRYDRLARRMDRIYAASDAERAANRAKLDAIARAVKELVPCSAVASDQAYRIADLAIDFAEDVGPLSAQEIDAIVGRFTAEGATAKVSSIHVNGWFGTYNKLTMARRFLADVFKIDIDTAGGNSACLYAGDSPNDAPMFGHFACSVGVANIHALAHRCAALPAFVTRAASGAGFVEIANTLLKARGNEDC